MPLKTQLLIPAAGMGARLGANAPKALVDLAGKPLLVHTLHRFVATGHADDCIITVPDGSEKLFAACLSEAYPGLHFALVRGGAQRQDSVANGLNALRLETDIVMIHDAARPFVPSESIRASIEAAAEFGAATVAIPAIDTILVCDAEQFLADTPDRATLWACQTPQSFRVDVIRAAHAAATRDGFAGTDDASLVRRLGGRVKLVMGSPLNFKITTPQDLALARCVVDGGLL